MEAEVGMEAETHGPVNGGRYLPLNLYPRIFNVEKLPDFFCENDVIAQGMIT